MVNVHLVPHSHDDVGWLKTVDEYYSGEHSEIFNANVSRIITEVIKSLQRDENRRYACMQNARTEMNAGVRDSGVSEPA